VCESSDSDCYVGGGDGFGRGRCDEEPRVLEEGDALKRCDVSESKHVFCFFYFYFFFFVFLFL
jgi:hypothetical protein